MNTYELVSWNGKDWTVYQRFTASEERALAYVDSESAILNTTVMLLEVSE